MSDYALESTFDIKFTSRAFATGIPTTLTDGVVVIYEDNGTTEIEGAETLTADFDSITGLNNLRIVATTANGFESGKSYSAVLSAGTVGGVSVVGETVCNFSIERLDVNVRALLGTALTETSTGYLAAGLKKFFDVETPVGTINLLDVAISTRLAPTTASRTLDVTAGGAAGIDWANVENKTSTVSLTATTVGAIGTGGISAGTIADNAITADTIAADSITVAKLATGALTADAFAADALVAATFATNAITADAIATDAVAEIADAVWDEALSGHTAGGSTGKALQIAKESVSVAQGTAQAGSASTIQLAAGSNANNNFYDHNLIVLTAGTGVGQVRSIQSYTGATTTANVVPNWVVNPDATSEYELLAMGELHAYEVHEGVTLADDAITALKYDQSTAYPLASSDGTDLTAAGSAGFTEIKGGTWASGTDTLEAIRDRGDAAWTTANVSGLSTHSPADVVAALEADGSKLDHLWEMTEDDEGTRRYTVNSLENAPTGAGGAGSGARTVTVTVDDGETVLENATVRFTEGVNTYTGSTNASGVIVFSLDDATYTVSISKAGYTFTPTTKIVNGTEADTYSMTAVAVTAPPNASTTTGVMTVYDEQGSVESGVTITVQLIDGPGTAGIGYDSTEWAETSNGSGVVEFAGIILGARYKIWRGTSKPEAQTFTAPTTGTSFDLAEVIGRG